MKRLIQSMLYILSLVFLTPVYSTNNIFTHPPTDIDNVAEIVPLGNLNPGGGHVLPIRHMYLRFPKSNNGGTNSYPVYSMATGQLVAIFRNPMPGETDFDYQLLIQHTGQVSVSFEHMYGISSRIQDHLDTAPGAWTTIGDTQMMFFGELGTPAKLDLMGGEQIGVTKNYLPNWIVGVVDTRLQNITLGKQKKRYPTYNEMLESIGINLSQPLIAGNQTINATCFINYLPPTLKPLWFDKLTSSPKSCGQATADLQNRLQGAWFNPVIDKTKPFPIFDLEYAAISISPYNLEPKNKIQIGIASNHPLAALDPSGNYPWLRNKFIITKSDIPWSPINPDPAIVTPRSGIVCYDLKYSLNGKKTYDLLLLKMASVRRLYIKFVPTKHTDPGCASALKKYRRYIFWGYTLPGRITSRWTRYIR